MATLKQADDLMQARNALQAHCSPILSAARSLPVASAAAELAKAGSLTEAFGATMDDEEAVAAAALLDAAAKFVAAGQAAADAILGPSNWRRENATLDAALTAVGA